MRARARLPGDAEDAVHDAAAASDDSAPWSQQLERFKIAGEHFSYDYAELPKNRELLSQCG